MFDLPFPLMNAFILGAFAIWAIREFRQLEKDKS